MESWQVGFALHNLSLPADSSWNESGGRVDGVGGGIDVGCRDVAIVSADDPRVLADVARRPAVRSLLGSFRSPTATAFQPACLIFRESVPARDATLDAILAFRNALALSFLLRARAGAINEEGTQQPYWADTFDIFPVEIDKKGRLIAWSAALVDLMDHTRVQTFMSSPYVGRTTQLQQADSYLYRAIGREWRRRFQSRRPDRISQRLFRSLEVAFEAASVPTHQQESLQDWGVKIGLWVSAIEILARPRHGRVGEKSVRDLLGKHSWTDPLLDKPRYSLRFPQKGAAPAVIRVSAVQRLYAAIYRARNDFVHGNPVRHGTLRGRAGDISLPIAAALVYRTALAAFLHNRHPPVATLRQLSRRSQEPFCEYSFARAMRRVMGLPEH